MTTPVHGLVVPRRPDPPCSGSPYRDKHALVREVGRWPYLRCKLCGAVLNSDTERWVVTFKL